MDKEANCRSSSRCWLALFPPMLAAGAFSGRDSTTSRDQIPTPDSPRPAGRWVNVAAASASGSTATIAGPRSGMPKGSVVLDWATKTPGRTSPISGTGEQAPLTWNPKQQLPSKNSDRPSTSRSSPWTSIKRPGHRARSAGLQLRKSLRASRSASPGGVGAPALATDAEWAAEKALPMRPKA